MTLKHCKISKGDLFGSYLYKIQTFQNFQFQSSTLLATNEKIPQREREREREREINEHGNN